MSNMCQKLTTKWYVNSDVEKGKSKLSNRIHV